MSSNGSAGGHSSLQPPDKPDGSVQEGEAASSTAVAKEAVEAGLMHPILATDTRPSDMEGPEMQDISLGKMQLVGMSEDAQCPGRSSVQFSRPTMSPAQRGTSHFQSDPGNVPQGDPAAKDRRGGSLFNKLKSFATPSYTQSHGRTPSGLTTASYSEDEHGAPEQSVPQGGSFYGSDRAPNAEDNDADADADIEQSSGEEASNEVGEQQPKRRRRTTHRRKVKGLQTAPSTPKAGPGHNRPDAVSSNTMTASDRFRPAFFSRRATTANLQEETRQGVSEDEGRERISASSPWRRVNGPRRISYNHLRRSSHAGIGDGRRPNHLRRLTGFGASSDTHDGLSPSPWKFGRAERASNVSAAKWRQVKAGIKAIGQRRKAEINKVDHAKSAELLAELTAGVPAALILASMFQRDEHGNKRIPILLEQLKVQITDSKQVDSKSGDRHMIFRIEMEYGNGLTRMKWVVHRALRDFANLHARYKLQIGTQKYIKLKSDDARAKFPKFPRSTFPYLRGIRGLESDSDDEEDLDGETTGRSGGEASGPERSTKKKKTRPVLEAMRRKSSNVGPEASYALRREMYPERQRKKLETYLQQMIRYLIFRPESNRLCKFLELSALGVRLAAEGSYHGKEGLLTIKSGKGVDLPTAWRSTFVKARQGAKWFAVRHSYIVCVDSPEAMNIFEVFLVDSNFRIQPKRARIRDQKPKDIARVAKESASHPQHSLKLFNSERRLKLLARNERQLHQFEDSIQFMASNSPWSKPKRFESFAPVRSKVSAQWLVDGRDHMWNVSRAISMAKDVIYIHDWWLSPELYMRRPAAISQKWRLDRLLQRKAREGVKIFVIIYRNINSAIPIDSEYSKFSLLDLHPNIFVQRSPNQFRQNTFFWAHHEKLVLIDHMVAFVGGIDLCFGRWDTPQHSLVDDKLTGFELSDMPKDADHCQLWPGKDYSNPRVQDFYALDKPYEEMYDRAKVPRMPWHDIHMQVVGQPARDLTRHFVQRWNYILRQRKPTRPTPLLLPPPDFNPEDLEALGLDGTCEVQILRSACEWSLGTPGITEQSIQNAYIKLIEQSDHFVYIENQFFISSCEVEGTKVENKIGDALVERIIRASQRKEEWRAIIVIPLMPGFQNTVDQQDGTSVRLIMQCQFRSICRGEASIFGRVRAQGIEPEDYIQFYSLRAWGKIGPTKQLVTEQLYIHAKAMIVDDRVAIIGSANINERSMLGSRDSECAAIVRDTDMLRSTMAGEPYLVGRFPHTLRMRLMREHLGIDVDEITEEDEHEEKAQLDQAYEHKMDQIYAETTPGQGLEQVRRERQSDLLIRQERLASFNHDIDWEQANNPNLKVSKKITEDPRVTNNSEHKKDVDGDGKDAMKQAEQAGQINRLDTITVTGRGGGSMEVLVDRPTSAKGRPSISPRRSHSPSVNTPIPPHPIPSSTSATPLGSQTPLIQPLSTTDAVDVGGPPLQRHSPPKTTEQAPEPSNSLFVDMKCPVVDKDCMRDPLNDAFFLDTWHAIAENNTKLFRQVFRCMPDSEVKSWKEYKEYAAYAERFSQAQGGGKSKDSVQRDAPGSSGPPGQGTMSEKLHMLSQNGEKAAGGPDRAGTFGEKVLNTLAPREGHNNQPMGKIEDWAEEANKAQAERQAREAKEREKSNTLSPSLGPPDTVLDEKAALRSSIEKPSATNSPEAVPKTPSPPSVSHSEGLNSNTFQQKRRRRATTRGSKREFHASDDIISKADAEELMHMVQGALVTWPYDWLEKEEQGGNWLYSIDGLAPLEI